MYFMGQTFYKDAKSSRSSIINITNLNSITLDNGIYDDLFVTKNYNIELNESNKEWSFDTILYAMFNGNLLAGNIAFALETITSIRIKQREKGKFDWITIYDIPINSVEDLSFVRTYKYCKGNTDYEFAVLPVLNNSIEGNLSVVECESKFTGAYLMQKDSSIQMVINFESSQQRNHSSTTIQTLGREKPFYITNGMSNYESGNINVAFIQFNNCEPDNKNGSRYRKNIYDTLTNKMPKILKFEDGRAYIVGITDAIQESSDVSIPISTLNWTEIANIDSEEDLYENGFLDWGDL